MKIIKYVRIILHSSITTKHLNLSIELIFNLCYKNLKHSKHFTVIFRKIYKTIARAIVNKIDNI